MRTDQQTVGQEVFSAFVNMLADAVAEPIEARQSKPTVPRKLLSVKEAALALGRSVGSVRHLINSGEIPASCVKRIGRRVFLVESRLDKFIETL